MGDCEKLIWKKESGRCPGGETRPVYPDRGVWGKSWVQNTLTANNLDGSMGLFSVLLLISLG